MLKLPQITLVCIDCLNYDSALKAIAKSCEKIQFGAVKFLTDKPLLNSIIIDKIRSKKEYSFEINRNHGDLYFWGIRK